MNFFRTVGRNTLNFIRAMGAGTLFLFDILAHSGDSILRPRLTVRQIYFAGVMSLLIVTVSGLFMGLVLGLQVYNILVQFKAADALGFAVAAALLREIGPVLAALLFASSAGGAMTSEIGLMKTTEQIEAMNVMAVNPVARIVAPRFWAGVLSMPVLAAVCNVAGIYGAYLIGVQHLGLDAGIFWSQMQAGVEWRYDVLNSLIKSFVFGAAVTLVAVYQGFHCQPTAEGILRATTRTVVISALAILAWDFVLTAFMFSG